MSDLIKTNYMDSLVEQCRNIDTDESENWKEDKSISTKVIDDQKVYFWIRLYLKDENVNILPGDDIVIKYTLSGEELKTKFICYGKQGLLKDNGELITQYNSEDDKKTLCLMIEEKLVNWNDKIPFIRTLFKTGRHYEFQLIKRDELQFIIDKNNIILDWFDSDF
mgnify:CR=1 FL=1|jgi:hypothetical protein